MFKKILSLALVGLLFNLTAVNFVYADSKAEKEERFVEKIKKGVQSLGTGEETRVEVKLKDKTKLKGYISEIGGDNFVVVDKKAGVSTAVAYPQVRQVKGNNLSTGAKVAIGLGILAGVLALLLFFENYG